MAAPAQPTFKNPTKLRVDGDAGMLSLDGTADAHDAGDVLHYTWAKDGKQLTDREGTAVTDATFVLPDFGPSDAGTYVVECYATNAAGEKSPTISTSQTIEAPKPQPGPDGNPPSGATRAVWDAAFARTLLIGSGVLEAVFALLLLWGIGGAGGQRTLAWMVSLGLLFLSATCILAGAILALIEMRGRASITAQVSAGDRDLGDIVKAVPDIFKAWGTLTLGSAVFALAGIAMVCATLVAYRSLPDPSAPKSTPAATATATPAAPTASTTASPSR